jgi:hypothetical protein
MLGGSVTAWPPDNRSIVHRPQQFGNPLRLSRRREVFTLHRGQRAAQVAAWIAHCPPGRHGIAEQLPAVAERPVRGFQCAPIFNPPHHSQQFGGGHFGNRSPANPREDITFETPDDAVAVIRGPSSGILGEPLPSYQLEAVCRHIGSRRLHRLTVFAGVDSIGQQLAQCVPAVAGVFQTHVGIDPKGQPLFLASEPILQPPPLPPGRGDFQIQSALVEQPAGLLAELWLGITDRGIGQGNGATPCGATHLSLMLPPPVPGCQWKELLLAGRKTNEKARSYTGFWMLLELLGCLSGGAEGNRTPDLCSAIAALSHLSYSPPKPLFTRVEKRLQVHCSRRAWSQPGLASLAEAA